MLSILAYVHLPKLIRKVHCIPQKAQPQNGQHSLTT